MKDKKSLFVAIIGQPNAGKSSLMNLIVGEDVSIVTHKVQTTRYNIRGIFNKEDTQLVFIDTPGIFEPSQMLERAIVKNALHSHEQADIVCLIIDAKRFAQAGLDKSVLRHLKNIKKPIYAILNKVDLLARKEDAMPLITNLQEHNLFEEIFLLSVKNNKGVNYFLDFLLKKAYSQPWGYEENDITDQTLRSMCEEITRKNTLLYLHEEIPYSLKVETEKWEEFETSVKIYQSIVVLKDTQKIILVGSKGSKIKEIGQRSRHEMKKLVGKNVHLFLFAKVRENWIDKDFG